MLQNLMKYSTRYEHMLLRGDMNIVLLENDSRSRDLLNRLTGAGLNILNSFPTRNSHSSKPSLLDIVCAADLTKVNHFEQLSLPGISDHDMLFVAYDIKFNEAEVNSFFTFRDFKRIDVSALVAFVGKIVGFLLILMRK